LYLIVITSTLNSGLYCEIIESGIIKVLLFPAESAVVVKNIPDLVYHQPAPAGSAGIDISEPDSENERLQVINEVLHQVIMSVVLLLASRHSRRGFL
jgi:hypothetical protein